MNPELVISCSVKVFETLNQHGHWTPIGNHSRLTVNYYKGYASSLTVCDERDHELLRMDSEMDVTRYTVRSLLQHEVSRNHANTIIFIFYREDKDIVKSYTTVVEDDFKRLRKFSSQAQVTNSSSSESDDDDDDHRHHHDYHDDDEGNAATTAGATAAPPAAMRTAQPTASTDTNWDCVNCGSSNDENNMRCDECNWYRVINWNVEWQCRCFRVYSLTVADCEDCGMWRCRECTYQNELTAILQCLACPADRRRRRATEFN